MNKTELIASVAQKSDLTKKDAEKAVKASYFKYDSLFFFVNSVICM